jgi:hypothetical protein
MLLHAVTGNRELSANRAAEQTPVWPAEEALMKRNDADAVS